MKKVVAALGILIWALVFVPVASAGPKMSCQAAIDWQSDHNARGNSVDTSSQAAVDSYNSEARQIDAQLDASCGPGYHT